MIGSRCSWAAHTFCRSRAGGRTLMADTIRSSTTVTSSTRCAASRWRSSTSSTGTSSSRERPIGAPSRRSGKPCRSGKPAGSPLTSWRSPTIAAARPSWPRPWRSISGPAACRTSQPCAPASRPIRLAFPRHGHARIARQLREPPRLRHGRRRGMKTTSAVDTARLGVMLNELRLPPIKLVWSRFAEQADKGGWPAARFLSAIAEHELAERDRRRIERHLAEARLLPGKTLNTFDFAAVPMVSKAQVMAVAAGDAWLATGANLLLFGPPGGGKSHLASAIGLALVENGWTVLFTRTTDLVQKLQVARRELALEAALNRLDRFDLLILDDLAYVTKDQAETSVLFELISARYERRSILITANQPFGEWGKVFPDPAMTLAAIDRLVHHATIFEMNVESYRRRVALERKRGPGRPPTRATPNTHPD